jgi:hypothetical protein
MIIFSYCPKIALFAQIYLSIPPHAAHMIMIVVRSSFRISRDPLHFFITSVLRPTVLKFFIEICCGAWACSVSVQDHGKASGDKGTMKQFIYCL